MKKIMRAKKPVHMVALNILIKRLHIRDFRMKKQSEAYSLCTYALIERTNIVNSCLGV